MKLAALAFLTALIGSQGASAGDLHSAYGARGSGEGHGSVAVGGGVYLFNSGRLGTLPAPVLTLGLSYTSSHLVDLYLDVDGGVLTQGPAGLIFAEAGVAIRPTPEGSPVAIGLRVAPTALIGIGKGSLGLMGVAGGLFAGGGNNQVQFSAMVDFPMFFALVGDVSGTGFAASVRPGVVLDVAATDALTVFLRANTLIGLSGGLGVISVNVTGGVAF
ncbi:MAG: hypothetical protein U1E65_02510 [Myxococcota bacterium]